MGTVALLRVEPEVGQALDPFRAEDRLIEVAEPEQLLTQMERGTLTVDVLVLGASLENPVGLARQFCALDRKAAAVILCPAGGHLRVTRAVRRAARGHADMVCLCTANGPALATGVAEAAERVRQRRGSASTEQRLEARAHQLARVRDLELRALAGGGLPALMEDAVALLTETLHVEYAAVLELLPRQSALALRAGAGWPDGRVDAGTVGAGTESQASYTLLTGGPVIATDLRQETRFAVPPWLHETGVISGISAIIQGKKRPFGVLAAHSSRQRSFGLDDVSLMQEVARVLATAIERYGSERHIAVQHAVANAIAASAPVEDTIAAIMAAICDSMGWELGVFWLPTAEGDRLHCGCLWQQPGDQAQEFVTHTRRMTFLPGQMMPGRVWASGAANWLEDVTQEGTFVRLQSAAKAGFRAAFWLPVLLGGRALGVMEFLTRQVRAPEEDLLQSMLTIGRQIGQFIERQRAEGALRQSEERLRLALDAGHMGAWEWNILSGEVTWSAGTEAIHGFAPGTFGGTFSDYLAHLHPADHDLVVNHLAEVGRQGTEHDLAYRIVRPDGTVRWVQGKGQVMRDSAGRAVRMVGVCMDITARRQTEEQIRTLNAQLEQRVADRTAELTAALTELETFSYSVSHDLRAPLRSIDGFSQALLEDCGDQIDAQGQDYLKRIRGASQRMARLIDVLLHLSRVTRSEMKRTVVDLSSLVRSVAAEVQRRQPDRQVELVVQGGITVQGDEELLRVALENLLENAWKFTGRRVDPRVEFGVAEQDGKAVYFVRDNGAGFDMAYANKMFTAFHRLHAVSEFDGVGVGLATVHRIIQRHGGRIWAEAAVDQGATFSFTL